jgi:hypothetical protein
VCEHDSLCQHANEVANYRQNGGKTGNVNDDQL